MTSAGLQQTAFSRVAGPMWLLPRMQISSIQQRKMFAAQCSADTPAHQPQHRRLQRMLQQMPRRYRSCCVLHRAASHCPHAHQDLRSRQPALQHRHQQSQRRQQHTHECSRRHTANHVLPPHRLCPASQPAMTHWKELLQSQTVTVKHS